MKTYTVLYAEDVPHYGTRELAAADDDLALLKATDIAPKAIGKYTLKPDHGNTLCKRIVYIEGPDGIIAEGIRLDDFHLFKGCEALRRKIDAAEAMFDALEAQEMAEFDPEAARRRGYFDAALTLRQTALARARGQK